MAYQNNISLGIKLQPSKEVQTELETVIKQLNKNSSIDLKIDTTQINQSLNDFSSSLEKINSQIKDGFNFEGVSKGFNESVKNINFDQMQTKLIKEFGANAGISSAKDFNKNFIQSIKDNWDSGNIDKILSDSTKMSQGIIDKANKSQSQGLKQELMSQYEGFLNGIKGTKISLRNIEFDKSELNTLKSNFGQILKIDNVKGMGIDKVMDEWTEKAKTFGFTLDGVIQDKALRLSQIVNEYRDIKKNGVSSGMSSSDETAILQQTEKSYLDLIQSLETLEKKKVENSSVGIESINKETQALKEQKQVVDGFKTTKTGETFKVNDDGTKTLIKDLEVIDNQYGKIIETVNKYNAKTGNVSTIEKTADNAGKQELDLINKMADGREKAEQRVRDEIAKTQKAQTDAINKNIELQAKQNNQEKSNMYKNMFDEISAIEKASIEDKTQMYSQMFDTMENRQKEYSKLFDEANAKELKMIEQIANANEKTQMNRKNSSENDELKQAEAINKALLEEYQARLKLENIKETMQSKLSNSKNNEFIDVSVITNLQSELNSINTNTPEKEIKELQATINNLSSSDSQIVRLQNTISKLENNLTSMKGKYGSLVGDSSSKAQLESYTSQVEKLKGILNSLQNGGTISGQKLASELNIGTNASRELSTAVKNSGNALKLAQNDANSFANSIKKAFENAGIYMSVYQVINMATNALKSGVQDVIGMDTALGNLNKVVSMSSAQLLQMRDSAVQMGQELGRSSIEVANAQAEFGRLYKSQNEINTMTKNSLIGANVMDNTSAEEVAKSLTTIISSMKLEAKDSMTILDSMNEIQNNYRISAKDMMNALAEVGSTAYTSGADLQRVEGYITSIGVATGQSGEEVGNALRSVMSRIYKIGVEGIDSAGKPEKMLKDMGVAVRDSSGQFKEFSVIMDDLNSKWGNYSRTQQIAIAQSVAGVQRYNQFLALMQNYGMATDATNTALNSQGSALKENEIHMQTAEAKLGTLKATTEAFYMELINSDAIKSSIDGLTALISTFGNLPTVIGLTTSAIVAFGGKALISAISNVGGYIASLISLASTEGIVATATTELSIAMSTNPFGLIAIAIAGLTVGLVALNHSFEESTNYIGKMNEATKGLQELKSTENLVKQYNDLNTTINSTSSTVEQVTSAKEKLLGVQKQLASQNPELVDG